MKSRDILRQLRDWLRWLNWPRFQGCSAFELTAYGLLATSIGFLLFPSTWRLTVTIVLLAAAFLLIVIGQRRKPTEIEIAILVLVLAQVASARWSMLLDAASVIRSDRIAALQERRESQRDSLALVVSYRDSVERDQRRLDLVLDALWMNRSALLNNEAILTTELELLDYDKISLESTHPIRTDWWERVVELRPTAIVQRDSLVDSLRFVAFLTERVATMYADRAQFQLGHQSQEANVDRHLARLRILDSQLITYSKTLRQFMSHVVGSFGRDTTSFTRK